MTNHEIRAWYLREVGKINGLNRKWLANGIGLKDRAHRAWFMRNNARRQARSMMENENDVELLRRRDLQLYGRAEGPSFAWEVAKEKERGFEGDEIYERIIADAQATDGATTERLKRGRKRKIE